MRMVVMMSVVVVMFVTVISVNVNIELRRRNAAAVNASQAQFVAFDVEFADLGLQELEIESAIEHCADEHVAARACKTIKI